MYDLVQMLIDYGHKEIAFIGAKANLNVSRDRLKGYKQALIDNRIEIKNSLIYEAEEFTQSNGSYAINKILDSNRPTAVVATDDLLAFGAQETLNELGVKNMSIAGFNNIPMSEYQNPPLSSVDINAEELGFYATKLIIDRLEEKSSNRNSYIIDTKLIERESIKKI